MSNYELPETFWLGKISNEWPIHSFVSESQVIHWLAEVEGATLTKRRAWEFLEGRLLREVKVVVTPHRLESVNPEELR